jgi:heptosyltransferase-1
MYGAGTDAIANHGLRILVVRLGAMGDIIHTLPAAASLKHSCPHCHLTWAVESKWAALLEGNPFLDSVVQLDRGGLGDIMRAWRRLRSGYDVAVDFQGLIKSALVASAARADQIFGFHRSQLRERLAALFYSHKTTAQSLHVVDRNLDLAKSAGATSLVQAFPLPPGRPEGELPQEPFVLASPLAGWGSKQWPSTSYSALARILDRKLGIPLVINGPPAAREAIADFHGCRMHISGVAGLIHATRAALAVVGVDSGPLHLAAALEKPGVAVYGPTDPARNGPYGNTVTVLRNPRAQTSYKRGTEVAASMRDIAPEAVMEALQSRMFAGEKRARCSS